MVIIEYKNGRAPYQFELKNAEREMDFCISMAQVSNRQEPVKFKVTNKYGIVRIIISNEVKICRYVKIQPNFTKKGVYA